jgi:hypothetical protein
MPMNFHDLMLATIRGEGCPRIPWVPRLDLWYRANSRAGTLPPQFRGFRGNPGATLPQIVAQIGAGFHAIIPDFKADPDPAAEQDRALGLYNLSCMPYRTVLRNVKRTVRLEGERTFTTYRCSAGTVDTVVLYDQSMQRAGITISHIDRYAINTPQDMDVVGCIFDNAEVVPNYEGYAAYARQVGAQGLAAGFVSLAASPMHLVMRELMPLEAFFFATQDCPAELNRLVERIAGYWEKVLNICVTAPAELFLLGANYDARVTYPPLFDEHIRPWLQRFGTMLHERGKFLLTHTDGENLGLLDLYVQSGFDVADSICPKPMTQLDIAQVRQAFAGHGITIMGGIPSVALLRDSMSDSQFAAFLDEFFTQIGRGDHLILGISDTTPPAADFARLLEIGRRIEQFGPVPAARKPGA